MLLLAPAVLLLVQSPGVPHAVEVLPGLSVLRGEPDEATFKALKAAGVTAVVNLRQDGEGDFTAQAQATAAAGARYDRCPLGREPSAEALDAFRKILRELPKGSVILLHCASGNRAAGALYTFLVLDRGLAPDKALALAHEAGLHSPATEAAVKGYVESRRKP
ncbi:MAG TPA: sulfur transferase domain-containing protein [Holophagaceae bacterium]|nr:sulfur transferase domain-containing protein [Holophagaceae bacterium]